MATYNPPDLLHKWRHNDLTAEQAVGQLLQHLVEQEQRLNELERRLNQLENPRPAPHKPPR
jgi:hypothetical protein